MINLKNRLPLIIIQLIFLSLVTTAQTKTNLELIYSVLDSSINDISQNFNPEDNIGFKYSSAPGLEFLENRISLKFNSKFNLNKGSADSLLNYNLDNVAVKYNEMFRSGIFGDYLVEREANVMGSYILVNKEEIINSDIFTFADIDTVNLDEIENLENSTIPFTQSKIPPEPFFSSLLEPVIAIGAAAVTVFLFFNVRSK